MDLSIGKLQQLTTVARCGSFSRAAGELNISQPSLSRSIAAIEQRYGFPIFTRLGHGVEPTAAGAQVIAQAEPVLQAMRVLDSNLRLIGAGQAGELSMGLAPLLGSQLLALFAAEFFEPGTPTRLRAMIRPGPELLEALKRDAIEIFFFPETHLEPSDELEVEQVGLIRPACVVRAGHPLAGRSGLTMADLADFPWASSMESPFAPHVPSPSKLLCDNYHILRDAVLATELVCICSHEFVREQLRDGSLCEIHVTGLPLPPTAIFMATLRGRVHSPLAVAARERVRRHLADASSAVGEGGRA